MPYKKKGKCVYKKDNGKKVGCTVGPVDDYLAALHANVEETNMKFTKEQIEQIIKEELEGLLNEMILHEAPVVAPEFLPKNQTPASGPRRRASTTIIEDPLDLERVGQQRKQMMSRMRSGAPTPTRPITRTPGATPTPTRPVARRPGAAPTPTRKVPKRAGTTIIEDPVDLERMSQQRKQMLDRLRQGGATPTRTIPRTKSGRLPAPAPTRRVGGARGKVADEATRQMLQAFREVGIKPPKGLDLDSRAGRKWMTDATSRAVQRNRARGKLKGGIGTGARGRLRGAGPLGAAAAGLTVVDLIDGGFMGIPGLRQILRNAGVDLSSREELAGYQRVVPGKVKDTALDTHTGKLRRTKGGVGFGKLSATDKALIRQAAFLKKHGPNSRRGKKFRAKLSDEGKELAYLIDQGIVRGIPKRRQGESTQEFKKRLYAQRIKALQPKDKYGRPGRRYDVAGGPHRRGSSVFQESNVEIKRARLKQIIKEEVARLDRLLEGKLADQVYEDSTGRRGTVLSQTLCEAGTVTHYDVEFDDEIILNLPTEELTVITEKTQNTKSSKGSEK